MIGTEYFEIQKKNGLKNDIILATILFVFTKLSHSQAIAFLFFLQFHF